MVNWSFKIFSIFIAKLNIHEFQINLESKRHGGKMTHGHVNSLESPSISISLCSEVNSSSLSPPSPTLRQEKAGFNLLNVEKAGSVEECLI